MRIPRPLRLVEKSEAAMISAIEIYNKPDYKYREETFALLAVNAWELLLKAKLANEKGNDLTVIFEYENGVIKRNRSGNAQTISIWRAITNLENQTSVHLDQAVKGNIDGLIEIRDNATHFINASPTLSKQVLEFGTAAVRNYITLAKDWFARDFSKYHFFLMPIGFIDGASSATAVAISKDEENLIQFLTTLAQSRDDDEDDASEFHVSLMVNLSFHRSRIDAATPVYVTNDPNDLNITLSEEDIRQKFPWDYGELIQQLRKRYSDFKPNKTFHQIRMPLKADPKYSHRRLLDLHNPRGGGKDYYNSNILRVFDQHYTRR